MWSHRLLCDLVTTLPRSVIYPDGMNFDEVNLPEAIASGDMGLSDVTARNHKFNQGLNRE